MKHANLRYADRSERNVLDLYLPDDVENPPLVVWIHGGAWRMGDKGNPVGLDALLQAGFAVAAMNYRLSTEAIWPAQLEDLRDAFAFLRAKAKTYGYDGTRIASFGASAGGHLSAMAGIVLAESPETGLAASVSWFPPIDFAAMDEDMERTGVERRSGRNDGPRSPESALIGAPVNANRDLAWAASPLAYLEKLSENSEVPPFLIMHGAQDPLIGRGQSQRLASALLARRNMNDVELVVLARAGHGSGGFQKPEAIERVLNFLSRHMKDAPEQVD